MPEPIVFISRNRIREGKREAVEEMFAEGIPRIGSAKPRTALFAAYLDEAGREVRIVHVFPDAPAMTEHFQGADERSQAAYELIEPAGWEVYGAAPAAAVDHLRREADKAGVGMEWWPTPMGGFLRGPA